MASGAFLYSALLAFLLQLQGSCCAEFGCDGGFLSILAHRHPLLKMYLKVSQSGWIHQSCHCHHAYKQHVLGSGHAGKMSRSLSCWHSLRHVLGAMWYGIWSRGPSWHLGLWWHCSWLLAAVRLLPSLSVQAAPCCWLSGSRSLTHWPQVGMMCGGRHLSPTAQSGPSLHPDAWRARILPAGHLA